MNWLKKAYQDRSTRQWTIFILVVGPVISIGSLIIDPSPGWWQAWAFFWGFYPFFLLLLYLFRNTK